jgi:F-type H+-transporting ATPase subunit epsilon
MSAAADERARMILRILLPDRVHMEEQVSRVRAEAPNGHFCLLPRHVDFAAVLVPGILSWIDAAGEEGFAAVDRGTLVKCGTEVTVSVRDATGGADLEALERTVSDHFEHEDRHERSLRSAMARIEAGFVRRYLEIHGRGSRR